MGDTRHYTDAFGSAHAKRQKAAIEVEHWGNDFLKICRGHATSVDRMPNSITMLSAANETNLMYMSTSCFQRQKALIAASVIQTGTDTVAVAERD